MPSTASPCRAWNSRTAAAVRRPNLPSTSSSGSEACSSLRRSWTCSTSVPSEPRRRMGWVSGRSSTRRWSVAGPPASRAGRGSAGRLASSRAPCRRPAPDGPGAGRRRPPRCPPPAGGPGAGQRRRRRASPPAGAPVEEPTRLGCAADGARRPGERGSGERLAASPDRRNRRGRWSRPESRPPRVRHDPPPVRTSLPVRARRLGDATRGGSGPGGLPEHEASAPSPSASARSPSPRPAAPPRS